MLSREETNRLRRGAHIKPGPRKWSRRSTITAIVIVILALAVVAVAAFVSRKDTAPQTITASSIGAVDIGNVETDGIFQPGDLDGLGAGDTVTRCFRIAVHDTTATDADPAVKVYAAQATGDLAEFVTIRIQRRDGLAAAAGSTGCSTGSAGIVSATSTLAEFASQSTYETGSAVTLVDNGAGTWRAELEVTVGLSAGASSDDVAGLEATLALAIENQG